MMALRPLAAAAVLGLLLPQPAEACTTRIPEFAVTGASTVSADLPALEVSSYELERGCGSGSGSGDCSDVGWLLLSLTAAGEVQWDTVGAYIRVQSGDEPIDYPWDNPFTIDDGVLWIAFGDGDGQPPIDFTVTVQAVDAEGRLGAESDPIQIEHGGGNAFCCECVTAPASAGAAGSVWVMALAAFLLRRGMRVRSSA